MGRYGQGEGQFTWPVTIIADTEENIYVSDEYLHRIVAFNSEGEHIGTWGEQGTDPGNSMDLLVSLSIPMRISMSLTVSVIGYRNSQRMANSLLGWGSYGDGEGEFNMPWGVAVDELGDVYVVDWRNDRVQKFNAEGEFLFAFGKSGSGNGEFNRPAGIDVDLHGDIYIADRGNDRIQLFNAEGSIRTEIPRRLLPCQKYHRLT